MLDRVRLSALTPLRPAAALEELAIELEQRLVTLSRVAAGDAAAGAIASLQASERFGWLSAPASTMVQPSPVHTGLFTDPAATLDDLFDQLVAGTDHRDEPGIFDPWGAPPTGPGSHGGSRSG